ncbi:T9SS type A sorting domain-containing protein [Chitinophagaceae bacterium MMS25-I14]
MKNKNTRAMLCLAVATGMIAATTVPARAQYFQQYYPAPALYPNHSFKLVDGCNTHVLSSGHLMLAYDDYFDTDFPYHLYRTDANGTYAGTNTFEREYMLYQGSTRMKNCVPGSVTETSVPNGGLYELTGANPNAIFFMVMDNAGTPITSVYFGLPAGVTNSSTQRWLLTPSVSVPNSNFFICGQVNNDMYLLRINSTGSIIWSRSFPSMKLTPNAIMESPFNNGELLVVGKYPNGANDDAFFMRVNASTGNPISFNRYFTSANVNDEFTSITAAQFLVNGAKGYVIGGRQPNSPGTTWITRLNLTGTPVWSNLITQAALTPTGNTAAITGIKERLNTSGSYEYYSLASSGTQAFVTKLDAIGRPITGNNEFDYATSPLSEGLTLDVDNNTSTGGITVYGNYDLAGTPGNMYMTKAYFNGYTACPSNFAAAAYQSVTCNTVVTGVTVSSLALTPLTLTPTTATPVVNVNLVCGNPAAPSVSGGSNARMAQVAEATAGTEEWQLAPNPSGDKVSISGTIQQEGNVSVSVYDVTGRLVKNISNTTEAAGVYKKDISFRELGCGYGVYLVHITVNGQQCNHKLVYSPM